MAAIDQVKNADFELCWARGDDSPVTFTLVDENGLPFDISTWTLNMAVNTERDPADVTNEIFRVAGVFVGDGTDGEVSFTPPAGSLDSVTAPGIAYYDIQRDTPSIKTFLKAKVRFVMDIDKA